MKSAIQTLRSTIKKIIHQLKPQANGFSFLILTGKTAQGKKALLRQSHYQQVTTEGEIHTDIFYNQHGIIINLDESWMLQSKIPVQQLLKQLNRCHPRIKISGIIFCIDIHELTDTAPEARAERIKPHLKCLQSFQRQSTPLDLSIIFTKLDAIAGFSEFYQHEHASDLAKPLGFSFISNHDKKKFEQHFKLRFNQFIETLNQQVLNKVHPARSDLKRTLIREFPLQIDSLQQAVLSFIQNISTQYFRVQSLFFTSAEQNGFSLDSLNQKIKHEYALTVQDKFPLANNYRAYFIEGALLAIQLRTKQYGFEQPLIPLKQAAIVASIGLAAIAILTFAHYRTNQLLDDASKEWLAFNYTTTQQGRATAALQHLTLATETLDKMHGNPLARNAIQKLKTQLETNKASYLQNAFIPTVIKEIEAVLSDNQQPHGLRYQSLKIYLMFGNPSYYQAEDMAAWFRSQASRGFPQPDLDKKLALIDSAFKMPIKPAAINEQLVIDTRNFLNALPVNYLYYAIAKQSFPADKKPIEVKGFILAEDALPYYMSKKGFHTIIRQLPDLQKHIQAESWVLNKPAPDNLSEVLIQAYGYDYALWWGNFIKKTTPIHAQNYQEATHLTQMLRQSNSIEQLINLIQEQTSPELGESSTEFNRLVANQFTDINLLNQSLTAPLTHTLNEMEKFLTTLCIVNDQGKTAFTITKSRFQGDSFTNPLSALFNQADQLSDPAGAWTKQIAGDIWIILINDTKQYINAQWKESVYQPYTKGIAQHYPFDQMSNTEVTIDDFNRFFSARGIMNSFAEQYIKPFLDTSTAQWKPKEINNFVLPISTETIDGIIRANVITNMFFRGEDRESHIAFSLQKSDFDPAVSSLHLTLGNKSINDTQELSSFTRFQWPQSEAKLQIQTIEGKTFSLNEHGVWAFFKLLQKLDVEPDSEDPSRLQVLFEINGNSGRYILKAQNDMNPFTPGILNGFSLLESIV
jgi:intracellular multiplication protein IcmF